MLTITYNKKQIRINIKYLCYIIMQAVTVLFAVAGVVIILGTAGGCDTYNIKTVAEALKHLFFGFACCFVAYGINRFTCRFYRE